MAKCIRLEWVKEPNIPACAIGEPADFRGLQIRAVYDDGSKQEMDVILKMFNEFNVQENGPVRLGQVSYEKKKLPVQIPLKEISLTSIQAIPKGQMRCMEGVPFDRSQVTVSATYSDGSSRVIDNYKITPHLALTAADNKITFRYGRITCELPIFVQSDAPPETQRPVNVPPENRTPPTAAPAAVPAPEKSPEKTVVAISVARKPNRQKYLAGDTMVDLKGGRLDIIYSDGSVGQIDMTADGPVYIDSKAPGTGSISFTCLGKSVAFPIDVLEPKIVKLSISKQPAKLDYEEGEELNLAGLVLDVVYNDGSVRTVRGLQSHGFVVTMGHAEEGVTLSYEGEPFTIRINVRKKEKVVTALSVELGHEPNKVKYIENDPQGLDLSGAELVAQMSDGRRLTIPVTPDMVDPVDLSKSGRQMLTIRYMGHAVTCSLFVTARTLSSLVIKSPMQKMEYIEGEKVDVRGLSIEAVYDNGVRVPVENYAISPEEVAISDHEVCLFYEGVSVSIPIIVHPLSIVLLDWARQPVKTTYYTQEKIFSCDGGVLRIKMNDGSEKEVPLQPEMVSEFHTDRIGPQLLTVTYEDKTVPLSITVKERVLLGLRVVKKPRTEYTEGEEFDPSGLVVEALYAGETTEVVGVNYLPYGPLKQDTASVMLVYQDKAVVMPIKVSAPQHHPIITQTLTSGQTAFDQATPVRNDVAENISLGFFHQKENAAGGTRVMSGPSPVLAVPVPAERPISDSASGSELKSESVPEIPGPVGDPFAEQEPEHPPAQEDSESTPAQTGRRKWANVPAFYPSTFSMRFLDEDRPRNM